MNYRNLEIMKIVGVLLVSIALCGCSANRVSLTDQGLVSVEKQDSEKVKILWTDVYEQDGQKWIYGVLKQHGISTSSIKTHVDIQVLNPDGSIQNETITDDLFVPRNRIGKGPDWKKFRVQLPEELPEDSQIKMTVHSGSHKKTDIKS
ncbi:MAG: hypothetical protein ISS71_01345 [Phycisphaerae bacterium]|nr:hypothetical protein [Phycisphaerae bacterium]